MANTICSLSDLDALNDAIPVAAWAVAISCEATETLVSFPSRLYVTPQAATCWQGSLGWPLTLGVGTQGQTCLGTNLISPVTAASKRRDRSPAVLSCIGR